MAGSKELTAKRPARTRPAKASISRSTTTPESISRRASEQVTSMLEQIQAMVSGITDTLPTPGDPASANVWGQQLNQYLADLTALTVQISAALATLQTSLPVVYAPLLKPQATLTTSAAPTASQLQPYNATAGALTPALPALSNVADGTQFFVEKDAADVSTNAVVLTCAGTDKYASGSTKLYLTTPGARARVQAATVSGNRVWKVIEDPAPAGRTRQSMTVDDLAYPLVIAHRGSANQFPENSLIAYKSAQSLGIAAVEAGDVQATADGSLICMHDGTVDRTSTASGAVAAMTLAGMDRAVLDASSWHGGGWADQPIPVWADVLDQLGGKCVVVPEVKDTLDSTAIAMANTVIARGLRKSAIIQSFALSNLQAIQGSGIATMLLIGAVPSGSQTAFAATMTAAGVGFVCIGYAPGTDYSTFVAALHAAGIKVLGFTVDKQYVWDAMIAAGFDGGFTNDVLYAPRNYAKYRQATSTWKQDGTWGHGMIVGQGAVSGPLTWSTRSPQPSFVGTPGNYRWPLLNAFSLPGQVCPVANPSGTYTITVTFGLDSFGLSSSSQGPSMYVCLPDDSFNGGATGEPAPSYLIKHRAAGVLQSWVLTAGATTANNNLAATPASAPALSAALVAGTQITALAVTGASVTQPLKAGHMFYMPDGTFVTVSGAVAAGATSIPINAYTPSVAIAAGVALVPRIQMVAKVDPAKITVSRGDEPSAGSFTITDTSTRGGYICLRNTDVASSVESVVIS